MGFGRDLSSMIQRTTFKKWGANRFKWLQLCNGSCFVEKVDHRTIQIPFHEIVVIQMTGLINGERCAHLCAGAHKIPMRLVNQGE